MTERAEAIAAKIERFVRETVIPYERDPRLTAHGTTEELFQELRAKARAAGLMTQHIVAGGSHLSQRETAIVLKKSGLSPLGPVAVKPMAPAEGNMYLMGKNGTAERTRRFNTKKRT